MAQKKITGGIVDTAEEYKREHPDDALDALFRMQTCYMSWEGNRRTRRRCFDFTYGNQWRDRIQVDGKWMTEEEYLRSIGQTPLQNNLIRRLVNSALGVYRSQSKEPICVARDRNEQQLGDIMTTTLQCNWQRNNMKEMNSRSFEEFLISGMVVHRKRHGHNPKGEVDCWTDYVSPEKFVVDGVMRDFRAWDCSLVGEIHDISFSELIHQFARTNKDYEKLSKEYSLAKDAKYYGQRFDRFFARYQGGESRNSFLLADDPSVCRVFELWTLENRSAYHCHDYLDGSMYTIDTEDYASEVQEENSKRIKMAREAGVPEDIIRQAIDVADYFSEYGSVSTLSMPKELRLITASPYISNVWHCRYITPTGMILKECDSPYAHGGHPYVFKFYPFINGEIHSFVEGLIDVQKQVNRTLSQTDMITRASSKGALLVPESSIPDDSTIKEINDKWSKPTAAIKYKDDHGRNPRPTQETGSPNISAQMALLQTYQKLMEDQSGIHGAVQGKPGTSSESGVLYAQQAQNSTMTLLDLLDTYASFERDCAMMDVQNIQQYYTEATEKAIVGTSKKVVYDPKVIRNIIYDIAIGESVSTPAYRQLAQDYLNQWVSMGLIPLELALQYGNFPNGDALLQGIQSHKEQQAQMQQQAAAAMPQ